MYVYIDIYILVQDYNSRLYRTSSAPRRTLQVVRRVSNALPQNTMVSLLVRASNKVQIDTDGHHKNLDDPGYGANM